MPDKIKLRRGTAALWTERNPVLAAGELGLETDTRKVKYGDGVTAWNSLPYAGASGAGPGDVVGPESSTDNALARFDGTTGKLIQNSGATLSDAGALAVSGLTVGGARVPTVDADGKISPAVIPEGVGGLSSTFTLVESQTVSLIMIAAAGAKVSDVFVAAEFHPSDLLSIPGYDIASNGTEWVTDGDTPYDPVITGLTVDLSSVLGGTYHLVGALAYIEEVPLVAAHTQAASTISDSTEDGRALLTAASVPAQLELLGFGPIPDIAAGIAAQVDDRISGMTGTSTEQNLFTTADHATPVYVRNPDHWAADVDLTALGVWNDKGAGWGEKPGFVAISPYHYICANHANITTPATLRFVAADGTVVERAVITSVQVATTDIRVGHWATALPDTITPMPIAWGHLAQFSAAGMPVVSTDQEKKLCISDLTAWTGGVIGFSTPADSTRAAFYEIGVTGDSGNPVFVLWNNHPALISIYTTGTSGPAIPDFITEIQAAIDSLGGTAVTLPVLPVWEIPDSILPDTGAAGADGAPGSVWRDGAGVPSNALGINGDYYLNETNGDVYVRAAGIYSLTANIRGAAGTNGTNGANGTNGTNGAAGAAGAPGSVWRDGAGVPSDALGINGDYYLNETNGDVYVRASGSYSLTANIRGGSGGVDPESIGFTELDPAIYSAGAGDETLALRDNGGGLTATHFTAAEGAYGVTVACDTLTADRQVNLQNKDGSLALLEDLVSMCRQKSSTGESTSSSTTLGDMHSSMHLDLLPGKYDIVLMGSYCSSVATEGMGLGFAFTGTGTFTDGFGAVLVTSSTESYGAGTTAGTALLTGTAGPGASLRWPFRMELQVNVTVAGTFKPQIKSEIGGANSVTIPEGACRIFCAKLP